MNHSVCVDDEPPGASDHDDVARRVAELFGTVLDRSPCELDESFFHLGGDSLKGMSLLAQVRTAYGVRLRLVDLFEHGTPRHLADRISRARRSPTPARRSVAEHARRRRGEFFPLSLAQEGFYEMNLATGGAGLFNSLTRLDFVGDVDPDALLAAVAHTVRRQSSLRTLYGTHNGRPAQRLVAQPSPTRQVDLRHDASRLERLVRLEHLRGFDLHRELPCRFTAVRTGDRSWSLLMAIHHIAVDGMSQGLLVDEIATWYAHEVGAGGALPDLSTDYLQFAEWQRNHFSGGRLGECLDQLRRTLSSPSPPIACSSDARGFTSRIAPFDLSGRTASGVDATAAGCDATAFVVLVAAMLDFGRRRNGQPRQLVSIQSANRSWPGADDIVGCFANTLHVACDLDPSMSGTDIVGAVRAAVADALAYEDLPSDFALRELTARGWDLAGSGCLPKLGFALQPPLGHTRALPGCVLSAQQILQRGDTADPTNFPLVVELFGADDGLRGVTHRLLSAWPGDSFGHAERQLRAAIDELAGLGG
ncbi:condensation domain-containing protein [Micromonospora sp. NPDC048868]|uniref:condensation domain-containing protein n=1 Tax=Micromonospora sp. NPDC048868 TaxID=3364258 RepID=UPI003710B3D6